MTHVDFIQLSRLISNEDEAFRYLCEFRGSISCPFCGNTDFYTMSRKRLRCKHCKNDIKPLNDTRFNLMNLTNSEWLAILKLFELSVSARKASQEIHISYKSALKAYEIVRRAIAEYLAIEDEILRGEIELDESYFGGRRKGKRGRGAAAKTIVFGILERGGKVSVNIVKDVKAETLMNETVKKVRRGSIVYTDKWRGYDSLMFCGYRHLNIDHRYKFKQGKVYINGIEGFWSFAKERLIKYHGISKEKFLYYIKEMEWRYNNRQENLYSQLLEFMLT